MAVPSERMDLGRKVRCLQFQGYVCFTCFLLGFLPLQQIQYADIRSCFSKVLSDLGGFSFRMVKRCHCCCGGDRFVGEAKSDPGYPSNGLSPLAWDLGMDWPFVHESITESTDQHQNGLLKKYETFGDFFLVYVTCWFSKKGGSPYLNRLLWLEITPFSHEKCDQVLVIYSSQAAGCMFASYIPETSFRTLQGSLFKQEFYFLQPLCNSTISFYNLPSLG